MTDNLKERLRNPMGPEVDGYRHTYPWVIDLCEEAFNRITELEAKLQRLGRELNLAKYGEPDFAWEIHKDAVADLEARLAAAEAGEDALAEAAKPFADAPAHGMWGGPMVEEILTYEDGSDENSARHKGRISPAKFKAIRKAIAAYEARRKTS